jgi:Uma2 family endonuclease
VVMTTIATGRRSAELAPPPLRDGDRLSQPEFHRRYLATPEGFKAELVEGIVHIMASPVGTRHGGFHIRMGGLFVLYQSATPGVEAADNTTLILGPHSEPQPDLHLRLAAVHGGRTREHEGILAGPPELAAEVSDSTRALDLGAKRRDYDRAGILEYLVLLVREGELRAFGPGGTEIPNDDDGIYRSKVFPGLWIDAAAIVAGDLRRAIRVLNKGLKSPEHAAFVRRLKASSKAGAAPKPRARRRK